MPPKRGRSTSPAKATGAKKPVASASVVASSQKKPATASAKPPAKKAPAKKAPTKSGASAAGDSSPVAPSKPGADPAAAAAAAALLQCVGRGFSDRVFAGCRHKRALRTALDKASEDRLGKLTRHETRRRKQDGAVSDTAAAKRERQEKLQEDLSVAAFDGDAVAVKKLLSLGASVHKKDLQGNVVAGEAAVNGQAAVLTLLLAEGADPNAPGMYGRTPLWRAAFNSHGAAIQVLLEGGADPRISAQSQLPSELCLKGGDAAAALEAWDVKKTDALVAAAEKLRDREVATAKAVADAEAKTLDDALDGASREYDAAQKTVVHCRCDLERRIVDYDTVRAMPNAAGSAQMLAAALAAIKDTEGQLDALEAARDAAMDKMMTARTEVSVFHEDQGRPPSDEIPSVEVPFMKIADVVLQDAEQRYTQLRGTPGHKWPFLVDVSGRASTFLRYRDTNYVDAMHPNALRAETLRRCVVGALRHGKPLVVDFHDAPLLEFVRDAFEAVEAGLWAALLDGSVTEPARYKSLLRESDGADYDARRFSAAMTQSMIVLFVSSAFYIDDDTLRRFIVFRTPAD
jgi:hypothetical protein